MNLAFYIARRYLFAKKSNNIINIISTIPVFGVCVATIAMVCVLSVFNGFKSLNTMFLSVFDSDLKITAVERKVFDPTTDALKKVFDLSEIQQHCGVLQENALVLYDDRQTIAVLKGVDTSYRHLVKIDSAIIDGDFILNEDMFNYGVLGYGLATTLGIRPSFAYAMEIYVPERVGTVNIANLASAYRSENVFVGGVYHVNQPAYNDGFMILSIDLLREMLSYKNEVTAVEIKLAPGVNVSSLKKKISSILGDCFEVKDRYEQQESFYKMLQIEKCVTYLMLCFILILTLFNVLGSIAILMIEKEEDVRKLRSMGADNSLINRIFLFEGWMISLFGSIIGVVIGIGLCFLQQRFGFISLGQNAGTFIVDAYPVEVEWTDIVIVLVTALSIGFIAVLYPVHFIGRKRLFKGSVLLLFIPFLMIGCGGGQKKKTVGEQKSEIAVTIDPLCYFGEHIAGDEYTFFSVVPAGRGPETYDPSLREMLRVEKSKAFFYFNLLGLEQVLIKSVQQNKADARLFNIAERMDFCDFEDGETHDHHEHEEHDTSFGETHGHHHHEGRDPHIWTSFTGAKVISENICKALQSLNREKSDYYQSNYLRLRNKLEQLEEELHSQLDSLSCRSFVIFHPALTYFAEEFGLVQYSMEEDGKDPSPASLKKLIEGAKASQVKVVFVQLEFDRSLAEQIAKEIGARIVTINPLDKQWDVQMRRIAKALVTKGEVD